MGYRAFLLFLVFLTSCGGKADPQEAELAQTTRIFFQVECQHKGPRCEQVKRYLEKEIPRFKYSFTEESSKKWPYFQAFDLNAKVPIDSLMPPHTRLHQFIPYQQGSSSGGINELVVIKLFSQSEGPPDYQVDIYRLFPGSMESSGTSGLHTVNSDTADTQKVAEMIRQSVIRYSYK